MILDFRNLALNFVEETFYSLVKLLRNGLWRNCTHVAHLVFVLVEFGIKEILQLRRHVAGKTHIADHGPILREFEGVASGLILLENALVAGKLSLLFVESNDYVVVRRANFFEGRVSLRAEERLRRLIG